jgi:hypothetical protein
MDNNTENKLETSDKSQLVPGDALTGNSTAETPALIAQTDAQPISAQAPSSRHPSLSRSKLYGKTLLRTFVAALISQIAAYAVFYIVTRLSVSSTRESIYFGDIIALIIGFSAYIIATVLTTMLTAKLLHIERWFLVGLFTSITLVGTAYLLAGYFGIYLPFFNGIESTFFMAAMVLINHRVKDSKRAIFFMVAAVLAALVLLQAARILLLGF